MYSADVATIRPSGASSGSSDGAIADAVPHLSERGRHQLDLLNHIFETADQEAQVAYYDRLESESRRDDAPPTRTC